MRCFALAPVAIGFFLAACAESNSGPPAPSASASSSASVPAKPVVVRKVKPADLRAADEKGCLAGTVDACRRMADRYRGYGHPAGCGLERDYPETVAGRVTPPTSVRIKRLMEDEEQDRKAFLYWIAKACDLGDVRACEMEHETREVRLSFWSTIDTELDTPRSEPNSWAGYLVHEAVFPGDIASIRAKNPASALATRLLEYPQRLLEPRTEPTRPELTPELMTKLQAICDKTLDCDTVIMMLDRYGYPPEAIAPLRVRAANALVQACAEGACVCGHAAEYLPREDPRVVDLARWGCENGEATGCYMLGKLYEEGRGVEKDEAMARALYEVACPPTRGWGAFGDYSQRACARLSDLAEGGTMPPKNKERAIYYTEHACLTPGQEKDHAPCVKLARYWAQGVLPTYCWEGAAACLKNAADSGYRAFYGSSIPDDEHECLRPSVKALCAAHEEEIKATRKPAGKKK